MTPQPAVETEREVDAEPQWQGEHGIRDERADVRRRPTPSLEAQRSGYERDYREEQDVDEQEVAVTDVGQHVTLAGA